jgi:aspartyl-tRNA(Asn)/glutamyl-tRNA(Gln) amidotransferase subunit A
VPPYASTELAWIRGIFDMSATAFESIDTLSHRIDTGALSPVALTQGFIDREKALRALNCFVVVLDESALRQAEAAEKRALAKQRLGPLDGIPVAIKDNIDVAGVPTSNGFGGGPYRLPQEDAEVVRRLREAGAVILGKLNMEEAAIGPATDNPHFGRVTNPYRPGYSPGGSSGGSGAAVAAGLCCAALGTDTGGSVRIPASYCGIVGLKASYGRISTRGVVPLSYGLDHVGPLTRTVADAERLYAVLAGFDPRSPESRSFEEPPSAAAADPTSGHHRLDGLRIGILRNFDEEPPEEEVAAAFRTALEMLANLGAEIRPVQLPTYDMVKGRRAGFLRVETEAAHIHAELYRTAPHRISPLVRGYLDYGMKASAQQLLRADRVIANAAFELRRCFDVVHLIASPTTPQASFPFDGKIPDSAGTYTILANFAGCPALSLPMGRARSGLPIGLQLMAPERGEAALFRAGATYEAAAGIGLMPPAPFGP